MQQIEASFSLIARELRSRNGIEDVDVGPSCSCFDTNLRGHQP